METDRGMHEDDRRALAEQMREAERAGAAPYLDFPPTRWWEPPAISAWAGAQTWLFSAGGEGAAWAIAQLGLVLLILAYVLVQSRRHGALPMNFWGVEVPAEIKRSYTRYFVGVIVVIVAIGALLAWAPTAVAVVGAMVLTLAGFTLYDRDYRAAAERARERLA